MFFTASYSMPSKALLVLIAQLALPARAAAHESHAALTARLLDGYGPIHVRPSVAEAEAARARGESCPATPGADTVEVQVYVDQFQPINMLRQTYEIDGFLRAWWSDPRLRFNGTDDGGCADELSFKAAERARIWKPEFYWEGARKITLPKPDNSEGTGELLKVSPSGGVWWSRQVSLALGCPVAKGNKLDRLPFDTQTCDFLMGMYAETAAEVQLRWRDGATALDNWDGACLAEWSATRHVQVDLLQEYAAAASTRHSPCPPTRLLYC